MAKLDPSQAAEKWKMRTQGATAEYADGVRRVTQAPGQAAAAQRQKWQNNVAAAAPKWAARVAAVSLSDWQDAAANKGAQRIAAGVQGASTKMERFFGDFLPHLDAGVRKVAAMPSTTFEDRVNRAIAMMRHNREYGQRGIRS